MSVFGSYYDAYLMMKRIVLITDKEVLKAEEKFSKKGVYIEKLEQKLNQ